MVESRQYEMSSGIQEYGICLIKSTRIMIKTTENVRKQSECGARVVKDEHFLFNLELFINQVICEFFSRLGELRNVLGVRI